ncbi:MAG TPA: PDZ domain-containing protein [Symbiobacteriaceae bacterium]|nr:PDZ domain-containing protein [Symbiobacteriaceae bacterium]
MASLLGIMRNLLATLPKVILNGWALTLLLIAVLLVYMQYRRVEAKEAELYGIAKHSPLEQTFYSLIVGVFGGALGSLVLSLTGVGLVNVPGAASALLYLWPVSVVLGALNPRHFCFAYSGALVSLVYLIFGWPRVDVASLMGLVAVLHMVEALLIWLSGATCNTPISISGQMGEAVPGFMMQRFWPVPLVLPFFTAAGPSPVDMPLWWPILRPDALLNTAMQFGWQFMPFVVTLGYGDLAITAPPDVRARKSSGLMFGYSFVLLALAIGAGFWRPLVWLAVLFSAFGHEAMAVWAGRVQLIGESYLKRPAKGVAVQDVLPGSPALAAGLGAGSVILAIDDYEVHNREQLHNALMAAPSFVRMMYRNGRQLEQCRLPRPPEGLLGLGVILLPEAGDLPLAKLRRPVLFQRTRLER